MNSRKTWIDMALGCATHMSSAAINDSFWNIFAAFFSGKFRWCLIVSSLDFPLWLSDQDQKRIVARCVWQGRSVIVSAAFFLVSTGRLVLNNGRNFIILESKTSSSSSLGKQKGTIYSTKNILYGILKKNFQFSFPCCLPQFSYFLLFNLLVPPSPSFAELWMQTRLCFLCS